MESIQYVVATYRMTWNLRLKLNLVLFSKAALAYILTSWQLKTLMPLIIITCDVIFPLILVITELQFAIINEFRIYSQSQYFRDARISKATVTSNYSIMHVYCCDIVNIINIINMLESYTVIQFTC